VSFFESLVVLLLAAIVLLQFSRRLAIPYPAMLAAAGVVIALIPGTPTIRLDPQTVLALFIAPALVDAAFDFPAATAGRLWRPLVALAVVAVLLTAGAVAWLGVAYAGLPLYAALALGAIVAPPDAAAATAVLNSVAMPRGSVAVLKGESLLNDALALLLFGAATALQAHGSLDAGIALSLGLAAPGGILLGIVLGKVVQPVTRYVAGTLGGNLLEFAMTFGVWILAEHLHLSPVLCLVAFAMTLAKTAGLTQPARARVHSFAVWESVVFLLNVLAFLLMGMQAREIVGAMSAARLHEAMVFAGLVIGVVIGVRLIWVMIYNRLSWRYQWFRGGPERVNFRRGILVGWCGMRGLLTLATAFALPAHFPQRDLIVLSAFAVVLATLVVQGLTLSPLVRLMRLNCDDDLDDELAAARRAMAESALASLEGKKGEVAARLRKDYALFRDAGETGSRAAAHLEDKRVLGLGAIRAQRKRLELLRREGRVGADAYLILQEELDFRELAISSEEERMLEES
jgi:CPA1 family monovalent cation:H+ antiporter